MRYVCNQILNIVLRIVCVAFRHIEREGFNYIDFHVDVIDIDEERRSPMVSMTFDQQEFRGVWF